MATYAATTVDSSRLLPAMTSVLTGQPIGQHGITWDSFEFSRGYSRSPTLFDYLDLSGGRDSAVFFMDEALAQLAKPEPYTDYQICGPLRAECAPQRLVLYIRDYVKRAASGHGYGHAVQAIPDLLVVHLPQGRRAADNYGAIHRSTAPRSRQLMRPWDRC